MLPEYYNEVNRFAAHLFIARLAENRLMLLILIGNQPGSFFPSDQLLRHRHFDPGHVFAMINDYAISPVHRSHPFLYHLAIQPAILNVIKRFLHNADLRTENARDQITVPLINSLHTIHPLLFRIMY
jgi:hypothetical protein